MADKPDWFKMDPAKFLQDSLVDAMSTAELGCAIRLLCRQWIDGWIPDDLDLLARLCRVDRSAMDAHWVILQMFFPEVEPGKRANRFMWVEREVVQAAMKKRQDDGREAVNRRWEAIRKQKDTNRSPIPHPIQESDTDKEKETDTPPTPPRGKGRKRPGVVVEKFHPAVQGISQHLAKIWPRTQPEGEKINMDGPLLRSRLHGLITKSNVSPDLLTRAAEIYLAHPKKRYRAPQFFFGPGGGDDVANPWLPYVQQAMSTPTPQPAPLPLEEAPCPNA